MAPAADFFKKYQARAPGIGIDPLGYYLGGWGYARMQLLEQAINATKGLDDAKLADYFSKNAFNTIMIDGLRFGKNGEWVKARQLQVQYHDITDAANLDTWRGMSYQTVLTPAEDATGKLIYPYANALKA
jgi:branched-chain amino acid transport system substrate-binding protein